MELIQEVNILTINSCQKNRVIANNRFNVKREKIKLFIYRKIDILINKKHQIKKI